MGASWSRPSVGTKESMAMLLSLSFHSTTDVLTVHLPQLSLFLMPSHNQGLLLETPMGDRLGI